MRLAEEPFRWNLEMLRQFGEFAQRSPFELATRNQSPWSSCGPVAGLGRIFGRQGLRGLNACRLEVRDASLLEAFCQ